MNKAKMSKSKKDEIKRAYDRVFSDETIAEEQLAMARELESFEKEEGQEW